jgi:hypothetical protein
MGQPPRRSTTHKHKCERQWARTHKNRLRGLQGQVDRNPNDRVAKAALGVLLLVGTPSKSTKTRGICRAAVAAVLQ